MFPRLTGDVTIVYQGGSGGSFLFYLLLLSNDYLDDPNTIWERIYKQFPSTLVADQQAWKHTECWPNNDIIKHADTTSNKLYLVCNPLFCSNVFDYNMKVMEETTILLLYTDLSLQLRMAYDKQAYWFTEVSKEYFNAPTSNITYLRKIKSNYANFNNYKVDPTIPTIISTIDPHYCLRLQDVFANIAAFNNEQQRFIEYWISLRSVKTKRLLKIDN